MTTPRHRRPPPFAVLAQDGRWAARVMGRHLTVFAPQTGAHTTVTLAHEASLVAWSPTSSRCAVAGQAALSLLRLVAEPGTARLERITTIALPDQPHRLAVGDDGLIAAVIVHHDRHSHLRVWAGGALAALVHDHRLGEVVVDHLWLDAPRRRLLLWGPSWIRLLSLAPPGGTGPEDVWRGQGAPAGVNGFLFPLAGDRLGAYSREMLSVFATPDAPITRLNAIATYPYGDLETVVSSPDGRWLAWLFNTTADPTTPHPYHLRAARLADQQASVTVDFDAVGAFPGLAIDDGGQITLIDSQRPHRVTSHTIQNGQLIPRITMTLADEA